MLGGSVEAAAAAGLRGDRGESDERLRRLRRAKNDAAFICDDGSDAASYGTNKGRYS